ncbi:methyltransferase domain-containing protein [Labrenzia suaedae]|uniref:Methyltransferase domain-containing protein n=2 Tax=Roseibium litorale TaxID=2803841 RepID=A0ABR9CTE0_9HYPH|nr:methyltransferase domain-containing protein [Roseibium litorale]
MKDKPGFLARKVAADILGNVVHKRRPLDGELDANSGHSGFRELAANDKGLVRAILGACLRHRGELNELLDRLLDRRIPEKTGRVTDILHVAMAQMLYLDIPDRAAVSLAVDHASVDRRAVPYKGLVNGVLRRLGREREDVTGDLDGNRLNTPGWLLDSWTAAYGEDVALAIAGAHQNEAALDLTVKDDPAGWAERLGGVVVGAGSVRLHRKGAVDALEGFAQGNWWVQDAAASMPARLLGDLSGKRAADLCAAPGGKTAQLAAAGAKVTAVDISQSRLKRVTENLARLGLEAEVIASDLREWEPSAPFDAILLDAPCSATGTIRRHPDVPWIKQAYDVGVLSEVQSVLLRRVAGWLQPGGTLVYCTCSMERAEGEDQIASFLTDQPGFELVPVLPEEVGGLEAVVTPEGYLRTLPCHAATIDGVETGLDGFFAARIRRL